MKPIHAWGATVVAALMIICVSALLRFHLLAPDRITAAYSKKIKVGMTHEQVNSILGKKGTNITSLRSMEKKQSWVYKFQGERGCILVSFFDDLVESPARYVPKDSPGFAESLWQRLDW